jgi:GT2 family glycosyltransferase
MQERVSILIITYNRPKDLLELLQSLVRQTGLSALEETLILDNASTESYEEIKELGQQHPELKINFITAPENLGVARGRNFLMSRAKGSLYMVLDDDVVLYQPTDFERLARLPDKPFFRESNTAIVTPRVIYEVTKTVQVTAFPHKMYDKYSEMPQFLTSYYTGCAHLLKKEALEKTGLYPEDFFYGMEEYDLSYRIINAGYALGYDNEVTIGHKESPYGRQANYKKLQMQWLNKSKVAWRYLPVHYFLSTALLWSFEYLRKAKGHWGTWFSCWFKIITIPFTEKRKPLHKAALNYLKKTEARLWF